MPRPPKGAPAPGDGTGKEPPKRKNEPPRTGNRGVAPFGGKGHNSRGSQENPKGKK